MKRRRSTIDSESENEERWLVSYADFITLLFAFFAMIYSVSSVNQGKYRVMSDSIVEAFSDHDSNEALRSSIQQPVTLPNAGIDMGEGEAVSAHDIIKLNETRSDSLIDLKGQGESIVGNQGYDVEFDLEEELLEQQREQQLQNIADDLNSAMREQIDNDAISITHSDDFIEVEINNKILFPSGSAHLSRKAIPVLTSLAKVFDSFVNNIQVEGFTDNQPIQTEAFPSNWELSAARAASVVHLLMQAGIEPQRMVAMGYGEYHPIAENDTAEGRQKNRRVVIVIPTIDYGNFSDKPATHRRGFTGQKRIEADS